MSDFLDRFGDQLAIAGRELATTQGAPRAQVVPQRRRPRFFRRGTPLLVGIVVLAGGSAYAATKLWDPILGRPDVEDVKVTSSASDPPPDQLDALGILRRPQQPSDTTPTVERLLRSLAGGQEGVRVGSIRALGSDPVNPAALVSIEQNGKNQLCVLITNGGFCGTSVDLLDHGMVLYAGDKVVGLVPDGVREIEVTAPGNAPIRTPVADNYFELFGFKAISSATRPPKVRWLDEDGKDIGPPLAPDPG